MMRLITVLLLTMGTIWTGHAQSPEELSRSVVQGQALYQEHCATCHRRNGQGLGKNFPPLAQSDYLLSDVDRAIGIIWQGLSGPIEVNGRRYDAVMAPVELSEAEVVDVMNYVLHAWGNQGPIVDSAQVAQVRENLEDRP